MKWPSIPQLFSNLIGQILPGVVVLILVATTILGPNVALETLLNPETQRRVFTLGSVIILLVVSQTLGMLVGQLWISTIGRALQKVEARISKRSVDARLADHEAILAALKLSALSVPADKLPRPFVMHDHLYLASPEQAARFSKVRAEGRHCRTMAFAAIPLLFVNFCVTAQPLSSERVAWGLILLGITAASTLRALRLVDFQTNGIATTWLSLASAQQLPFQSRPTLTTPEEEPNEASATKA